MSDRNTPQLGTGMVKDIDSGAGGSAPSRVYMATLGGDTLYFSARLTEAAARELWAHETLEQPQALGDGHGYQQRRWPQLLPDNTSS